MKPTAGMGHPEAQLRAPLLAVPNVSEGRDASKMAAIGRAFDARLLDTHSDPDHNRSVFTLAGEPGELAHAVLAGAAQALTTIDVAPIVYTDIRQRGAACVEALVLGDLLGAELQLPVFLYGELTGAVRTRAGLRRGGPEALARRIGSGELAPDFGPRTLHPSGGAVLVAARAPLVAFNVELAAPATLADARAIAAAIREGGVEGLPSVRAIGVWLAHRAVAQVSTNVEDHHAVRLSDVVQAIARHARPIRAELVGLAPRAALEGFPEGLRLDNERVLEDAIAALTGR